MAVKFLTAEYCYIGGANWLDSITAVSFHCRVRFDTIGTSSQFVFRHRLGTTGDQISLRKGSTGDNSNRIRWSVTAGGVLRNIDSVFTPSAGATYDFTVTWQQGQATGMFLYLDGVLEQSGSDTTTQGTYNSAGGDLYIAARASSPATEYGQCTLEEFTIWTGVALDADEAFALHNGAWPHQIGRDLPAIYLPMYNDQIATLIDQSGNDRKIVDGNGGGSPPTDIIGGAINDPLRPMQEPLPDDMSFARAGATGGGSPNQWTLWVPDVDFPQDSVVISGLTNSIAYQFKVNAIDDTGNPSGDSAIAEATPTTFASSVTTPAPWRRSRYLSKYRSGN